MWHMTAAKHVTSISSDFWGMVSVMALTHSDSCGHFCSRCRYSEEIYYDVIFLS